MTTVREEKKRQTRKAILEAAVHLFGSKGYDKTSIDQLARKAGVGKGTIYSYFRSKSEILLAFCDEELEYLHKEMGRRIDDNTPFLDALVEIFMIEFRYVTRNREFGRVFLREVIFPSDLVVERSREIDDRFIAIFIPLFEKAQQRGELRLDVELLFATGHFYALYIIAVSSWYSGRLLENDDVEMSLIMLFKQALIGLSPVGAPLVQSR